MASFGGIPKGTPVIAQINAAILGKYEFELYPELWEIPDISKYYALKQWEILPFTDPATKKLPTKSGIYMFVVSPYSGNIKDHSYIFYVGQTNCIIERYNYYLKEKAGLVANPRPKIIRFLNHLEKNLFFHFTLVPLDELDQAEDLLKDNLTPPANDRKRIYGRLAVK